MFAPHTAEVFFSLRIARMRRRHTLTYNGHLTRVKPLGAISRLESTVIQCHYLAYLDPLVERFVIRPLISVSLALALLLFLVSCSGHIAGQPGSQIRSLSNCCPSSWIPGILSRKNLAVSNF